MKAFFLFFSLALFITCKHTGQISSDAKTPFPTVTSFNIPSTDSLYLKADYYNTGNPEATTILLFHQAKYSRGEYLETGPKFNTLGFNCLAIDQRSGNEVNGVVNEAYQSAESKNLPTTYPDALPDLEAALNFAMTELKAGNIIVLGSSYSATLVFVLAAKNPDVVDGIIAFSPGEYFTYEDKTISDFAKDINCPVFITSAKDETPNWKPIFDAIPDASAKMGFIPTENGIHGSRALWEKTPNNKEYWEALSIFLDIFK